MKNELGMEVPLSVCKKAKEMGCYQGVKYVYPDGNYGGELPASSIGGNEKSTHFEHIDIANANKVYLVDGWVAFTSPLDADLNVPLNGASKQIIKPSKSSIPSSVSSSSSTSFPSSSNKTEVDPMLSKGLGATDFETKLQEATRMWRENEEEKRKQNEGGKLWDELDEEEFLKKWDEAEVKQLDDENLLEAWDEAEIEQLDEVFSQKKQEELPLNGFEDDKSRNEFSNASKDQVSNTHSNQIQGNTLEKQVEDAKFSTKQEGVGEKLQKDTRFHKENGKTAKKKKVDSRLQNKQGMSSKKQIADKRLQGEKKNAKEKQQDVVKPHKSMKVAMVKWLGVIVAVFLVVNFVLIPLIDDSEAVPSQYLEALNKNSIVTAYENGNDEVASTEDVMASQEIPENYINSIGMKFVLIPEGEFMMGSPDDEDGRYYYREGPVHEVTIENTYYMGKYEVTQKQWAMVMGSNPSYSIGDNRPVEGISWDEVQDFVEKLNSMEGTDKYRLPSEAEWEYACRAGTETRYYFGDNESDLPEYAWYSGDIYSAGHLYPNGWGLYDMHGNVYEFVQDEWHLDYEGAPDDGTAWNNGVPDLRTLRSGSLNADPNTCRSSSRTSIESDLRLNNVGFRLVMDV
ncbi:formylglycine-generating enzyme family protein [Methanococcoides methylutens]|uniref:Sulfatase-modifying factor enzyme-like domain-containing protein n=1 Tax=Methanococcoides methylutens MM1 TaxID=1434104 RepID=A0A0E3WZL8_METMT|nr:formylglycine-generating enzyme family protein [Methanococcoides methylutens]AKB84849.1 hypothetical protein MCMEM_0796 [Methanococcoides methylutens MM1]